MGKAETLEKALQKAISNGWKHSGITDEGEIHFSDKGILVDWLRGGRDYMSIGDLMLDHDFAKALWGEDVRYEYPNSYPVNGWKYHLQKMVISSDPIKYLGDNL